MYEARALGLSFGMYILPLSLEALRNWRCPTLHRPEGQGNYELDCLWKD